MAGGGRGVAREDCRAWGSVALRVFFGSVGYERKATTGTWGQGGLKRICPGRSRSGGN